MDSTYITLNTDDLTKILLGDALVMMRDTSFDEDGEPLPFFVYNLEDLTKLEADADDQHECLIIKTTGVDSDFLLDLLISFRKKTR